MSTISGPEMPARGTGPIHARHTAGGPTTSIANQSVSDIQPPGTDQQLTDAVNSSVKMTAVDGHATRDVEAPEHGDEKPANTESSVREGKRPGLAPGMARRCGPRSWIPRDSGSPIVRCPIARAVVETRPSFVTLLLLLLLQYLQTTTSLRLHRGVVVATSS